MIRKYRKLAEVANFNIEKKATPETQNLRGSTMVKGLEFNRSPILEPCIYPQGGILDTS